MINSSLYLGEIMKIREEYICPLELVHDMIKGKLRIEHCHIYNQTFKINKYLEIMDKNIHHL